MISLLLICLLAILSENLLGVEVETGESSLYFKDQNVSIGYVSITEQTNVYYQYFQMNKTNPKPGKNELIIFIGHNVSESSQKFGYMGYMPYYILKNTSSPIGLTLEYNENSLNSIADLVVLDLARGSGFSTNTSPKKIDYALIADDLDTFVQRFAEQEKVNLTQKKLIIYAGYEMSMAAINYASVNNKNADLIIENPWFGYSSFSQLYYILPAYGITNRDGLDMISNNIYNLQSSDYGKDLDDMYDEINQIRNYIQNNISVNWTNPVYQQDKVEVYGDGATMFFDDCKLCRAYCSLQKSKWSGNLTIRQIMKRELVFDYTQDAGKLIKQGNGRVLILQSRENMMSNLQNFIEANPLSSSLVVIY